MPLLLIINTGSTTTKLALYRQCLPVARQTIRHTAAELAEAKIFDQYALRLRAVEGFMRDQAIAPADLAAVVARGGLLRPMPGGCYRINRTMVDELQRAVYGEHASNLSAPLAWQVADGAGCQAYIVDPVVTDELHSLARLSGLPELPRRSVFHALNHKAVARRVAAQLGKAYGNCRLIVAHLGGGISVGAHCEGRVIDVSNALDGEGPFTPERSGSLPAGPLVQLCFDGRHQQRDLERLIAGHGGLLAYLGTSDLREITARIDRDDLQARLVLEAMAYQIAKGIGAQATVLKGRVEAIVLTGGLAHCEWLIEKITERIGFLAPVRVLPGEDEMGALAQGAWRVVKGEEPAGDYPPKVD